MSGLPQPAPERRGGRSTHPAPSERSGGGGYRTEGAPGLAHAALPRSSDRPHAARYLLHPLRPLARWLIRRRFRVVLHGAENVPATGPVIYACNHTGWADGPVLAIFSPRPAHALTKVEMFTGLMGPFLRSSGQIPLDRRHADPAAIKACLRVLRDGHAVGIFPEGARGHGDFTTMRGGAAYLALVSGAPVVPVVMFGIRRPGEGSSAIPPRGGRVDVVYGTPWRTEPAGWPRNKSLVSERSEQLRAHLAAHLADAVARTGLSLPGPLPAGDKENRPGLEAAEETS